ncbi:TatD family hydrolase [uncultured Bacteroides sp.]|uniref:TatD family hydrolase n=1 Tax=uncultured Bacteroides sp. TaxID=162156 RepID=UPI0026212307|nr:TatD family hydrolase [uncultured Bacteroides sp.]
MIKDIHSHSVTGMQETTVYSFCMKDKDTSGFISAEYISIGIHPWYVTVEDIDRQTEWIKQTAKNDKRIIAIGECGTDKLCDTDITLQTEAFHNCIAISEELKLPLIIHSVKTSNEIIRLKSSINPVQPWIIHGFRGKPELAMQYISNGFFLSFGKSYNTESLKITPLEKILFETDEYTGNISDIITHAADTLNISTDELNKIISENAKYLFFNR